MLTVRRLASETSRCEPTITQEKNEMAKEMIVVGDTTTHGGKVITGSGNDTIDGKAIARKGDLVECPGHGINPIIEGDASFMVDDKPVALEGHHAACGCELVSQGPTSSVC
jgi:uncharacterized Zn-binding protein involved in type VI secretion